LSGYQAEDRRYEPDKGGNHGGAELDDRAMKGPDFAACLPKFVVDPREAGIDPVGEVVQT
jgi:hypothetical protein